MNFFTLKHLPGGFISVFLGAMMLHTILMEIPSLIAFAVPGCRILDYTRRGGWWLVVMDEDDGDNMSDDVPDVHMMLFQYWTG